jgi:hypothetical protein
MKLLPSLLLSMIAATSVAAASIDDLKPLTEPGFYEVNGKKFERGLYSGGNNQMPETHQQAGEKIAQSLVPLDDKGAPNPKGKIVAVAVGHSNTMHYFQTFAPMLKEKSGSINPQFELVNVASSSSVCENWVKIARKGYPTFPKNAQVVFLLTTYHRAGPTATGTEIMSMPFEEKMLKMKKDLKYIVTKLVENCPNVKMVYIGSDAFRGYGKLEPQVYEEAFAVKWLIEDQLKGDPELAFEGPNRKAPWLSWGGYIWQLNPPRNLFKPDGVHSLESGRTVWAQKWYDDLSKNSTTRPWLFK